MCNKKKIICRWPGLVLIISLLFISVHVWAQAKPEFAIKGKGNFYLVGMGPGDLDLATVRAMKIVQEADLIICSRSLEEKLTSVLMDKEVMVVPATVRIWHGYGKQENDYQGHELEEFRKSEKIRGQLITKVRTAIKHGKTVAVLACGDPLIYGPKAWYLEEFKDLKPIVIPGVSCFNAANAALRKSITSGKETSSVVLTSIRDIEKMSAHHPTMVIFTMGTEFKDLTTRLKNLYPSQTPIGIVLYAGYKEKESVIRGTLKNIMNKVGDEKLPFEHLIYVGDFLNQSMKRFR